MWAVLTLVHYECPDVKVLHGVQAAEKNPVWLLAARFRHLTETFLSCWNSEPFLLLVHQICNVLELSYACRLNRSEQGHLKATNVFMSSFFIPTWKKPLNALPSTTYPWASPRFMASSTDVRDRNGGSASQWAIKVRRVVITKNAQTNFRQEPNWKAPT